MVGHTGFLVTARRMAPGCTAPERRRRPAPRANDAEGLEWNTTAFGLREVSERKLRRLRRSLMGQAEQIASVDDGAGTGDGNTGTGNTGDGNACTGNTATGNGNAAT